MISRLRKTMPLVSVFAMLAGIMLIIGTIESPIGWMQLSDSYLAPSAALFVGGVASAVAQIGLETVEDKQSAAVQATTRQNRSRVYEELVGHIVESFTSQKTLSEAQARAKAVAWGSPEVLAAMSDWLRYASAQTGVGVSSSTEEYLVRYELVYRVARLMRHDLQTEELSRAQLLCLIFDDFNPATVFPDWVLAGRVGQSGEFSGSTIPQIPNLSSPKRPTER